MSMMPLEPHTGHLRTPHGTGVQRHTGYRRERVRRAGGQKKKVAFCASWGIADGSGGREDGGELPVEAHSSGSLLQAGHAHGRTIKSGAVPIWDSSVFNQNNARRELRCIADFYLFPKHDGAAVRQKLVEVALTSPYLQIELPIIVAAKEKPYYTHYQLKAYPVEGRDQLLFVTDLTIRGKEALSLMGIEPAMPWLVPPEGEESVSP